MEYYSDVKKRNKEKGIVKSDSKSEELEKSHPE